MENLSRDKIESLIHAALILNKDLCGHKSQFGTKTADNALRELLLKHGSFERIAKNKYGMFWQERIQETEGIDTVIKRLERAPEFKTLTIADGDYPMREHDSASPVLYARGDLSLFQTKTIAIVGTRKIGKEDTDRAARYMDELIEQEYNVVSGLAKGCDTLAHAYFMDKGRKTIAVLGTPLDKHYPAENKTLQDKIGKEHLLVSQYPIGIATRPGHFAYRNLTTVTLARDGILVIAAKDKSGTLHAVRHCTDQKKELRVLYHTAQKKDDEHEWLKKYEHTVPDAPVDGS